MEIVYKKVSELKPYEKNPRVNDNAVDYVANSIKDFGFKVPIVIDKDNIIVAGHTRLKASKKLGLKEVPCIVADDLDEEQIKAFRLADNKVSELASWDFELLGDELEDLDFEMADYGFEIETNEENELDPVEDETPQLEKETNTKRGYIYICGKHRVMCGDSTDKNDIAKLMNGERADITFTSPPYNTQQGEQFEIRGKQKDNGSGYYGNSSINVYNEYQDNLSDSDYAELLIKSTENALNYSDDILLNLGILKGSKNGIIELLNHYKENFLDILVWNKSSSFPIAFQSQLGAVSHRCELIFCFNQKGNRKFTHPQWKAGTQINRIDTVNANGNEYSKEHSATFPVELPFNILKDYADTSCLDIFGGTGTTMIACEQLDKKCYTMEIDPYYVDLIVKRWENYTGKKAELVSD